jgi:hypothetical protein
VREYFAVDTWDADIDEQIWMETWMLILLFSVLFMLFVLKVRVWQTKEREGEREG